MIVTTAITAATPTTIPTSVRSVRNLFARRLPPAMRNDSSVVCTNNQREPSAKRRRAGATPRGAPLGCAGVALSFAFVIVSSVNIVARVARAVICAALPARPYYGAQADLFIAGLTRAR